MAERRHSLEDVRTGKQARSFFGETDVTGRMLRDRRDVDRIK